MRISLLGTEALLIHQALAALLNAIHGVRFEEQTGMSEAGLAKILEEFSKWVDNCKYDLNGVIVIRDANGNSIGSLEREFLPTEIRALRNSLEIVMLDLGHNEFFTVTGFSLDEAKRLLDRLNAALLDPLHLDRASESVAH
jgi:hypothetical protein